MVNEGTMFVISWNDLRKYATKPMIVGPDNAHKGLWAAIDVLQAVPRPAPPTLSRAARLENVSTPRATVETSLTVTEE